MRLLLPLALVAAIGCEEREVLVEPKPVPERAEVQAKVDAARSEVDEQIGATKKRADSNAPEVPTQNSGENE